MTRGSSLFLLVFFNVDLLAVFNGGNNVSLCAGELFNNIALEGRNIVLACGVRQGQGYGILGRVENLLDVLLINQMVVVNNSQIFGQQLVCGAEYCYLGIDSGIQRNGTAAAAVMANLKNMGLEIIAVHSNDKVVCFILTVTY